VRFRCPDRAQVGDEDVQDRQSRLFMIDFRHLLPQWIALDGAAAQQRRSCLGKSVRAWMLQRLSHVRQSISCQACS
jgi:hypothetical protein